MSFAEDLIMLHHYEYTIEPTALLACYIITEFVKYEHFSKEILFIIGKAALFEP
jgi:hypothetical protein